MKTPLRQNKQADWPTKPKGCPLSARDRVLEISCKLFAEAGFHGTHLRDICKRAGTNVAGVNYYFQSKEGLYQAVIREAGRRLSEYDDSFVDVQNLPPEQRLYKLIESLMQKLGATHAWIAKILTRELVDPVCRARNYAAFGLERDYILLQAAMRDLLGANANRETIQLQALSVISDCIFYGLAGENLPDALIAFSVCLPSRACLVQFLTQRSLGALQYKEAKLEVSNP